MKTFITAACLLVFAATNRLAAQPALQPLALKNYVVNYRSTGNIKLWPNPAKGSVNIYMDNLESGDNAACIIYNSDGVPCVSTNVSSGNNQLLLSSFPEGMYFVKIILRNKLMYEQKLMLIR